MDLSSAYSVLSNVYANFSKKSGCFYVYSYRPVYDPAFKSTLKKAKNSPNIGIAIPNNFGIAKHIKSTLLYV